MIFNKNFLTVIGIIVMIGSILGCVYFFRVASKQEGTIKGKDETISLLKEANKEQIKVNKVVTDSLISVIESQKENANVVNLTFDKTKLKGSGNIVIDTKQLQAIACDTARIAAWLNKLTNKERKRLGY